MPTDAFDFVAGSDRVTVTTDVNLASAPPAGTLINVAAGPHYYNNASDHDMPTLVPRDPTPPLDPADDVYPNSLGVQFLIDGVVDDNSAARPNGYDSTGPREGGSTYHAYRDSGDDMVLADGQEVEARFVDVNGAAHSITVIVGGGAAEPPPEPEPEPEPPPPPPPLDGFPTPSTVGFLGDPATLTPSGSLVVTQDGAVIEGLDLTGTIDVRANNVTIRNMIVRGSSGYWIDVDDGTDNTLVENVTVIGPDPGVGTTVTAVYMRSTATNLTVRRCCITRARRGISGYGTGVLIEENYIGDNWFDVGSHGTATSWRGGGDMIVRGNTLEMPNSGVSSCAALYGTNPINNVTYDGNLFRGGPSLTYALNGGYVIPPPDSKPHTPTNITIINNVFERATVPNPWFHTGPDYTIAGNMWDDGEPYNGG